MARVNQNYQIYIPYKNYMSAGIYYWDLTLEYCQPSELNLATFLIAVCILDFTFFATTVI